MSQNSAVGTYFHIPQVLFYGVPWHLSLYLENMNNKNSIAMKKKMCLSALKPSVGGGTLDSLWLMKYHSLLYSDGSFVQIENLKSIFLLSDS